MTKKDTKAVIFGSLVGVGALALLLAFVRKTQTLPVLAPTAIKWETQ